MNTFLQKLKKINFKQPKYILPLMGYVLILFVIYMIIDIASTDVKKVKDDGLQTTEYINSTIPDARLKGDGVGSKYENMTRQYGAVTDLSAVNTIDRNEEEKKEEYESKYSDDDIALLGDSSATSATVKPKPKPAIKAAKPKPAPKRSQSEEEIYAELEKALAEARLQGAKAVSSVKENADTVKAASFLQSNALAAKPHVSTANKDSIGEVVKKVRVNSDYFNTICDNESESGLIKAIIDENIKAVDGSRVRLRLLDDVEVSGITLRKGTYLYATMNGFGNQRVKGTVKSVLVDDDIVKINLSIYDTDGMEGLYVPGSQFRDTAKDIASGAFSTSGDLGFTQSSNSFTQMGIQAVNNAFNKTSNAISKAIKKNRANLKYGTFVYLINDKSSAK